MHSSSEQASMLLTCPKPSISMSNKAWEVHKQLQTHVSNKMSNNSLVMANHERKHVSNQILLSSWFPKHNVQVRESLRAVEHVAEGPLHPTICTPLPLLPYSLRVLAHRNVDPGALPENSNRVTVYIHNTQL